MTLDTFARILALTLHIIRFAYWHISEKSALKEKPFTKKSSTRDHIERGVTMAFGSLIGFQLLGLSIFPFTNSLATQLFGLALVVVGIAMSISARMTLGANWAHAAEYQIKSNHTLITSGIYSYIRHPIYFGMSLAYVGAELVAGSWLFLPIIPILFWITARQAQLEETILMEKFGAEYQKYRSHTYRFVPFVY